MGINDMSMENIAVIDEKEIIRVIDSLRLDETIDLDDIPNLDLYMDQVITLFEDKLSHTKRYEDDKLLTKTMINNYTKDRLLMPVKKKKYTREHILLMILLYELKQILSIADIKELFNIVIVDGVVNSSKLESIYEIYLVLKQDGIGDFKEEVKTINSNINTKVKQLYLDKLPEIKHKVNLVHEMTNTEETGDGNLTISTQKDEIIDNTQEEVLDNKEAELLLEEDKTGDMLTVVMLIQKANYYKKLAEKIIDEKLK